MGVGAKTVFNLVLALVLAAGLLVLASRTAQAQDERCTLTATASPNPVVAGQLLTVTATSVCPEDLAEYVFFISFFTPIGAPVEITSATISPTGPGSGCSVIEGPPGAAVECSTGLINIPAGQPVTATVNAVPAECGQPLLVGAVGIPLPLVDEGTQERIRPRSVVIPVTVLCPTPSLPPAPEAAPTPVTQEFEQGDVESGDVEPSVTIST